MLVDVLQRNSPAETADQFDIKTLDRKNTKWPYEFKAIVQLFPFQGGTSQNKHTQLP